MRRPLLQLVAAAHDDARAAVGEAVVELLLGHAPRKRHENGACPLGGPVQQRGVEAVVEDDGEALARLEAEPARDAPHADEELPVRDSRKGFELRMALAGREQGDGEVHALTSAAAAIASTIGVYPVQRQRWPESRSMISARLGGACSRSSRSAAAIRIPGVQKPHCSACASRNAACNGVSSRPPASPSTVWRSAPSTCTAKTRHDRTADPSSRTVHAPQTPCSQPTWVPVKPSVCRMKSESSSRGSTTSWRRRPFTVTVTATSFMPPPRSRSARRGGPRAPSTLP